METSISSSRMQQHAMLSYYSMRKNTFLTFFSYLRALVGEFRWHVYDKKKKVFSKTVKMQKMHITLINLQHHRNGETNYCSFIHIINLLRFAGDIQTK